MCFRLELRLFCHKLGVGLGVKAGFKFKVAGGSSDASSYDHTSSTMQFWVTVRFVTIRVSIAAQIRVGRAHI